MGKLFSCLFPRRCLYRYISRFVLERRLLHRISDTEEATASRSRFLFFLSFGFEIYISIKRVFISLLGPLNPLRACCVCFPNVNQGKRSILLSTWRRSVSFFYFVLQRCGHMKQKCSYSSPELGSSRSQESGGVFRVGPRTDPPLPG